MVLVVVEVKRQSAAADALLLLKELTRRVEALRSRIKWTEELEKALEEVKKALTPPKRLSI